MVCDNCKKYFSELHDRLKHGKPFLICTKCLTKTLKGDPSISKPEQITLTMKEDNDKFQVEK